MAFINLNGNLLAAELPCIRADDRGFTLGHGLFETIRVNHNHLPTMEYHWQRLVASAPLIGIELPFTREQLTSMILHLIEENHLQNDIASARMTLTHGVSARGIWPVRSPSPNFIISVCAYHSLEREHFSATIVKIRKNEYSPAASIKSLSYLDNVLAKKEAYELGFDEGILLNTALHVADGCATNVFMVKKGIIYTPLVSDGALPGTVRGILLKEFKQALAIQEKSIRVEELMDAEEIFLTNALLGIKPLTQLNEKKLPIGETALRIKNLLLEKNYF